MKRLFTLLTVVCIMGTMNAQTKLKEYFDYTIDSKLETTQVLSATEWYRSQKSAHQAGESPVISDTKLFYAGYIANGLGNSVFLDSLPANDEHISTRRVLGDGEYITESGLFASFLIKVEAAATSFRDFATWEASTSGSWQRGRLFCSADAEGVVSFGISKNSSTESNMGILTGYALNTYYLVVMEYDKVGIPASDENGDDIVRVYINPDITKTALENQTATIAAVNVDSQSDYDLDQAGVLGFNLKQQQGQRIYVSGLRVATSWEQLWTDNATSISPASKKLNIIVSGKNVTNNESVRGSVSFINLSGAVCLNRSIEVNETISAELPKGMYIVRFTGEDGSVKIAKTILK